MIHKRIFITRFGSSQIILHGDKLCHTNKKHHTYDQVDFGKDIFSLHELPGVAKVEHVVNTIGINTHWTTGHPFWVTDGRGMKKE